MALALSSSETTSVILAVCLSVSLIIIFTLLGILCWCKSSKGHLEKKLHVTETGQDQARDEDNALNAGTGQHVSVEMYTMHDGVRVREEAHTAEDTALMGEPQDQSESELRLCHLTHGQETSSTESVV